MLDISDLHVNVDGTEKLHDINLHIGEGETHILMGPNGSGKSTLLKAIMGFGGYTITSGSIVFKGKDITHMPIHERAHLGIGMMFQHPPAISGLKLGNCLPPHPIWEKARSRRWHSRSTWSPSSPGTSTSGSPAAR